MLFRNADAVTSDRRGLAEFVKRGQRPVFLSVESHDILQKIIAEELDGFINGCNSIVAAGTMYERRCTGIQRDDSITEEVMLWYYLRHSTTRMNVLHLLKFTQRHEPSECKSRSFSESVSASNALIDHEVHYFRLTKAIMHGARAHFSSTAIERVGLNAFLVAKLVRAHAWQQMSEMQNQEEALLAAQKDWEWQRYDRCDRHHATKKNRIANKPCVQRSIRVQCNASTGLPPCIYDNPAHTQTVFACRQNECERASSSVLLLVTPP